MPPRSGVTFRAPQSGKYVIEVKNLQKRYRDGTHAVKGVSFAVKKGEIFGLLGPNGAGKTTTMRILGTLHHPSGGTAKVLGLDVVRHAAKVRENMGFAMQEVGMDDLATAEEMLRFHASLYGLSKEESRKRSRELLRTFDLEAHAKRRVVRFSGGMQRRLDLAVSLIQKPKVLFLDEPSTGLDPTSRSELWGILRRLRDDHGITILLSTHYMEEADALCDRIAIMNAGELVAIDTPDKLKAGVGADTIRITTKRKATKKQQEAFRAKYKEVAVTDDTLVVKVRNGGAELVKVLQIATTSKLSMLGTRLIEPTLDDVFLQHTGTRIEAVEEADQVEVEEE